MVLLQHKHLKTFHVASNETGAEMLKPENSVYQKIGTAKTKKAAISLASKTRKKQAAESE